MTTNIVVKPANFPTKVTVTDIHQGVDGQDAVSVRYLKAGTEETFYCTTTRKVEAVDISYEEMERIDNLEP